ncbi:MAG: hypothetical protein NC313_07335 [Butyrivibrio sp.]|nr:hypothetical protein [Butyrivibrio sp.]
MIKKDYGEKNKEITFYVIRYHSMETGLISIYFSILIEIEYALRHGYVPFIDLQNNTTQYTTGELIQGTRNAWEYFWSQPSKYSIDEIYSSKNVILSGKNIQADKEKHNGEIYQLYKNYDFNNFDDTHKLYEFIKRNMDVKPYIYERVKSIWKEHFAQGKIIGVFIRGTDYTAFCPKGHPVQPSKEQLYEKVMMLRKKYLESKVFLVTEDEKIYVFLKEKLQGALIEIDDIRFSQYRGDDYIYKYCKGNTYQIGLCYLTKLLLLSKCHYLVASIANGSKFANIMNDNHYEERVILDLGVYK